MRAVENDDAGKAEIYGCCEEDWCYREHDEVSVVVSVMAISDDSRMKYTVGKHRC